MNDKADNIYGIYEDADKMVRMTKESFAFLNRKTQEGVDYSVQCALKTAQAYTALADAIKKEGIIEDGESDDGK